MSGVRVLVGTRKGAFILTSDAKRKQWDVSGPHFAVFFDGELLFTAEDDTFADAGKVGLWTKADSVTWFDDLRYGPVISDSPVLTPSAEGR